jgi:DNA polymerase III psi subunit
MEISPILFDSIYQEGLFAISPPPTIILDQPWVTITPVEKTLLEKILTAIRQSLNSITIQYQDSLDLSVWVEKPQRVIYFGKSVKGIPLYETVKANGVTIVASESLKDLSINEEARKKLWLALKKQFSV